MFKSQALSSMKFSRTLAIALLSTSLIACGAVQTKYRDLCAAMLSQAWDELELAKAKGFAGTVSYTKASSILAGAKVMQTIEEFDDCVEQGDKALFYIQESKKGQ